MATVRLDTKTETKLKRLAATRGQTQSEVLRDAISLLAEQQQAPTAYELLLPFIGIGDSGGRQLSKETGRRFKEILEDKHRARRAGGRRAAGGPARS
jgi:hypothetical protein